MLGNPPMYLERRLLVSLCCAGSLVAAHAKAQPESAPPVVAPAELPAPAQGAPSAAAPAPASPDTLETPYAEVPPVAPQALPPKGKIDLAIPPKADIRPELPIRARRKLALTGELGWNGLAGFGPILTYHAHPHVSIDAGAGFSLLGGKLGVRGRYNFLKDSFTPFVGVGFNYGSGFGQFKTDPAADPHGDPDRDPVTIDHGPSYLIQTVVGFDFIHRHGFTVVGTLGYAWLLNQDNYKVLAGELTAEEEKGFNIAFKGGLVFGVAMGYAFNTL